MTARAARQQPTSLPRAGDRTAAFSLTRAEEGEDADDGLTFEGYAAVFNAFTRIDSWEGTFDEQIAPGAFKKSIRERTPVMQFDHGRHVTIGSLPIGEIKSLGEDDHGLAVVARMFDVEQTSLLRAAIAGGAINGMSFRFEVVREEWRTIDGKLLTDSNDILEKLWYPPDEGPLQRTLKEIKVPELGPVVFPAYAETTASLRAREWAQQMRDDPQLVRDMADAALLRGLQQTSPATPPEQRRTAPPSGHSAGRDDAPPSSGHPSESPNMPTRAADVADRLRARLTEIKNRSTK